MIQRPAARDGEAAQPRPCADEDAAHRTVAATIATAAASGGRALDDCAFRSVARFKRHAALYDHARRKRRRDRVAGLRLRRNHRAGIVGAGKCNHRVAIVGGGHRGGKGSERLALRRTIISIAAVHGINVERRTTHGVATGLIAPTHEGEWPTIDVHTGFQVGRRGKINARRVGSETIITSGGVQQFQRCFLHCRREGVRVRGGHPAVERVDQLVVRRFSANVGTRRSAGQKHLRRIGHLFEPLVAHAENADLVRGTETVLYRAEYPV